MEELHEARELTMMIKQCNSWGVDCQVFRMQDPMRYDMILWRIDLQADRVGRIIISAFLELSFWQSVYDHYYVMQP